MMLYRAQYCDGKSSVHLSVILRYRGHQTVKYFGNNICILVFLLFTDSIMTNLLQRKHAKMFGQNGGGYGKRWLLAYKSSNISETGHCRNKVTIEDQ